MKRLLMVTLLLLVVSAFVSCNSYDVEGKPEVASNPAKKVFAYYPWDSNNVQQPDDTETPDDTEITDGTETPDEAETPDETETPDEEESDDDTVNPVMPVLKAPVADTITEEFEIYNRGETGELLIRQINLIDPRGHKIADLDNANYKKLFELQIQTMSATGVATDGWNGKLLTFDNTLAEAGSKIGSLCPLDQNDISKRTCKKSFDEKKYNPQFKILLNYNKSAAEALKSNPPTEKEYNAVTGEDDLKYKLDGDFWIEICTNDPTKGTSDTCGPNATSYRIQVTRQPNKPPKPIIKVKFEYTNGGEMSYRNIKDKVQMNLVNTCVSDPDDPSKCLDKKFYDKKDSKRRYAIKYKWEMKESPTPLIPESQIKTAGKWILDTEDPERADFYGLMITPRRYSEDNPNYKDDATCESECGEEPKDVKDEFYFLKLSNYLICRQKHCEKYKTKYYKVNIQAETIDLETDLVSDTADITVVPKIIPQARVVAQLTWKQGYRTKTEATAKKDGTMIDIDIHMIKKTSLEAPTYNYTPLEGVMGTNEMPAGDSFDPNNPEHYRYFRHDDCSFSDQGIEASDIQETIAWHASLDIDNTWGGNNFETPETIGLGPIEDKNGDGVPDDAVMDDQYLVVVGYVNCTSQYADKADRCKPDYQGEDGAYEVDARVDILIDGVDAPREKRVKGGVDVRPADNYDTTTKNFKIKYSQWKVIGVVKWDGSLPGPETNPKYPGDAIVSDVAMTDEGIEVNPKGYQTCTFDYTDAVLVPVWTDTQYYDWVNAKRNPEDPASEPIGFCE